MQSPLTFITRFYILETIRSDKREAGMRKSLHRLLFFTFMIVSLSFLQAQTQTTDDAVPEVPELNRFHEVIFKIWHDAWPDKNTALLKELVPEVEKGIADVVSARLPGILRDKLEAWEKGLAALQKTGADYKAAAGADNATRLLNAAEALHARFEALMRMTRPTLRELGDFHSSLYTLYHHYVPDFDIEKIRASAEELKTKMGVLNAATLSEQLQSKSAAFEAARKKLAGSVDAFAESVKTNREEAIKAAIEKLHTAYQAVEESLE
jgi:hypothetical protein